MPLQRFTRVYGIQDAKIAPLTADPASGTPTYGALIDVPGIKSFEISGDMEVKSLRGDNTKLATNSTITNIQVQVTHAKVSLDVLTAPGTRLEAWLGPHRTGSVHPTPRVRECLSL